MKDKKYKGRGKYLVLERPTSLTTIYANLLTKPAKERSDWKKKNPKKIYFFTFFSMQLFSADAMVFSKFFFNFFDPKKVKNRASKVAHNQPRLFCFTVQPRPQPTAQNWFFILWNLGTRHLWLFSSWRSFLFMFV